LPKKIQFQLLLADLALQLGNALVRRLKLRSRWVPGRRHLAGRSRHNRFRLARTPWPAQRISTP
jgi:hypothetical protein